MLADHALIQRMPDSTGGSRYHLHELVRDYAVERLSELPADAVEEVRARHFDHFLGLVERADATWETYDEQPALVALEPDQTNIESALAWAVEARDTDRALRMTAGLFAFWVYTAKLGRSAAMFARIVDLPWDSSSTTAIRDRGRALHAAGWDAMLADDVDLADRRFREGLALAEQAADAESAASNLRAIASVRRTSGDVAGAGQYLERALALSRAAGDERGTAWARNDLGGIAYSRGRVEEAIALCRGSRRLVRAARDGVRRLPGAGASRWAAPPGRPAGTRPRLLRTGLGDPGGAALRRARRGAVRGRRRGRRGDAPLRAGGHTARCRRLLAAGLRAPARGLNPSSDATAPVASRRRLGQAAFDEAFEAGRRLRWDQSQALLESTIAELSAALSSSPAGLTSREVEVLRLVALGLSNGEIGERLVVSTRTVHAHLRSIYDKLGVTTRTAAAHEAVRIGLA